MDTLLLEVVEHGTPQPLIDLCPFNAPPEPGFCPVRLLLRNGIACCLVERSPGSGYTSVLQLEDDVNDLVHLFVEPLVLPGTTCERFRGLETGVFAVESIFTSPLALRNEEVPHQLYQSTGIDPVCDWLDIFVVYPTVWSGVADMDEVVAVHGGIFARELVDLLGTSGVPVDISHDAGYGLPSVLA